MLTNYYKIAMLPLHLFNMAQDIVELYEDGELIPPSDSNVSVKSKLQHPPPPGIPRAFDVFSCPGGGNLINLIFPGAGIWSLLIGGGEFDR